MIRKTGIYRYRYVSFNVHHPDRLPKEPSGSPMLYQLSRHFYFPALLYCSHPTSPEYTVWERTVGGGCLLSCLCFLSKNFFFFVFFSFLGPHLWHVEVPRLGGCLIRAVAAGLCQIRAASVTYTTAHSNARSLNPLSEAKNFLNLCIPYLLSDSSTLLESLAPFWVGNSYPNVWHINTPWAPWKINNSKKPISIKTP